MAEYGENIQLDSEFTYQQYAAPLVPQNIDISGTAAGGSVTTINGDAGGGAVGPIVTFSGGVTGYDFQAVGTSVTLLLSSVATVLASLGLSKNNVAATAPTATDDSGDGYSINSLWTDTTGPTSYICQDATLTAAVWHAIP